MKTIQLLFRLTILYFSLASIANARQWYFEPLVFVNGGHDDNPLLLQDSDQISDEQLGRDPNALLDQSFLTLGSELRLGSDTENDQMTFDLDAAANRYDNSELDSEFIRAAFGYGKNSLLRDYTFEAGFLRDSTVESEIEDTGIFDTDIVRNEFLIGSGSVVRFSNELVGNFDLEYRRVAFDDAPDVYVEFEEFIFESLIKRDLSTRTSVTGELDILLYQPTETVPVGSIDKEFLTNLLLGLDFRLTPQDLLNVAIGSGRRESDILDLTGTMENSGTDAIYKISYQHIGLNNNINVVLDRAYDSSALGGLTLSDRASIVINRTINPQNIFDFRISYLSRDPIEGELVEREFFELNPTYTWRYNQFLSLIFDVRYREQTLSSTDISEDANSTYFTVGARYDWGRKLVK